MEIFPNPELPSMTKVTVPPGVRDEVTVAFKVKLVPKGTLTLEAVRVIEDDAGPPPPPPPVDPPPQPRSASIRQATSADTTCVTN